MAKAGFGPPAIGLLTAGDVHKIATQMYETRY